LRFTSASSARAGSIPVGVIDSGEYKGSDAVADLSRRTEDALAQYVRLANGLGLGATSRFGLATEVVEEAERLCLEVARDFPRTTFFAGRLIFEEERWYQRLLQTRHR
jgi:hypothetical protein